MTNLFDVRLGLGVKAPRKVRLILLLEPLPPHWVLLIILVNAPRRKHSAVHSPQEAAVREVQRAHHVAPDRSLLIILAPVNIRAAGDAGGVEDVGGHHAVDLGEDGLAVLHADRGAVDFFALGGEEGCQVAGDPAFAAPDKVSVRHGGCVWFGRLLEEGLLAGDVIGREGTARWLGLRGGLMAEEEVEVRRTGPFNGAELP